MTRGVPGKTLICSRCPKIKENDKKRYCNECANAYMREWRKSHPLNEYQKFKEIVRRKTNIRIERGLLFKQPCEKCNDVNVQAYHEDYNKPYDIIWLCKKCHLEHHSKDVKNHIVMALRKIK